MSDEKFDKLLYEIEKIHKRLDAIEKSSMNMDNHINFIQKTYNTVRTPLCRLVEYVSGRSKYEELPCIEKDVSL